MLLKWPFAAASKDICSCDTIKLRGTPCVSTTKALQQWRAGRDQNSGTVKTPRHVIRAIRSILSDSYIANMGLIYQVHFPSGKSYIGQTTQSLDVRVSQHKRCRQDTLVRRAFKKYSTYKAEVLIEVNDELLDHYETQFINTFRTLTPFGYNLSTGGGSGRKHSEVSKMKMSQSHLGVQLSDLHKQRLSESHFGRTCSETTRKKISESNRGKTRSEDFREQMSKLNRKHGLELPRYVYKSKNGYRVRNGKKDVYFTDPRLTDEEKLTQALQYRKSFEKVSND